MMFWFSSHKMCCFPISVACKNVGISQVFCLFVLPSRGIEFSVHQPDVHTYNCFVSQVLEFY